MHSIEVHPHQSQANISFHLGTADPIPSARVMIVAHRAKMAQAIALPLELCGHYIIVADLWLFNIR